MAIASRFGRTRLLSSRGKGKDVCAAQQAVEGRQPHIIVTCNAALSPAVKYHGLARRYLTAIGFLMRPLLNGGTLGRPER